MRKRTKRPQKKDQEASEIEDREFSMLRGHVQKEHAGLAWAR